MLAGRVLSRGLRPLAPASRTKSCSISPPFTPRIFQVTRAIIRGYSVALVGLGYRGYRSHFLSLRDSPSISVAAVCDTNAAALESFALSNRSIPTYTSLPELLQRHAPDFAIVSVPHGAHMECIIALAAKGVAVLKEKPVAESMDEYDWMANLPVRIGITFQKRFEPHFLHFRSLLPLVGRVAAVEASLALNITNLEETWRASSGVGVTEDLGCHMLDILVWLLGLPTSVMAHQVSSVRPSQRYGGDDVSDILMDWGRNCIGHVRLSRVAHRAAQSISVTGTDGTLSLDGHEITHYDTQGRETLNVKHQPVDKQVIHSMVQEFGDWVSGRQPEFSTSLGNVVHTVSVVDAIKKSLATRQVQHPLLHATSGPASSRLSSRTFVNRQSVANFSTTCLLRNRDRFFCLNTGALIPAVGLGTRGGRREGEVYDAVSIALAAGYRHIDTAQSSKNEIEIGRAIKDSGIPRDDIWITTKLDNAWHTRVEEALEYSLQALETEYVDLYLMHWPVSVDHSAPDSTLPDWDFINTWQEMQKIPTKTVRNIGVSNFSIANLQRLLRHPTCTLVPAVNQVELHPYWPSRRLLRYCAQHGIHCTAYSCLGSADSPLLSEPVLLEISPARNRSPQQILIMWGIQRGTSVLPKSVNAARIRDNFQLDGWELSVEDMEKLNGCATRLKSCTGEWLPGKFMFDDDHDNDGDD
ncbi:NADP-dependent oxidoreductase domain-containing protein [Aspergillus carlsbadensis]|nr:NADP-dependent oxidoreductase domain-containing protein [Aspergillus carlsbadensis]